MDILDQHGIIPFVHERVFYSTSKTTTEVRRPCINLMDAQSSNIMSSIMQQQHYQRRGGGLPRPHIQQAHHLVIITDGGYKAGNGAYARVIQCNSNTLLAWIGRIWQTSHPHTTKPCIYSISSFAWPIKIVDAKCNLMDNFQHYFHWSSNSKLPSNMGSFASCL